MINKGKEGIDDDQGKEGIDDQGKEVIDDQQREGRYR